MSFGVQVDFDESVLDIVDLANYVPRVLPAWLRERLIDRWRAPVDTTDDELIENTVARYGFAPWLRACGGATIDGKDVFVFESDAMLEPVALADEIGCGVQFVDPSPDCWTFTMCFTETRLQRHGAGEALACVRIGV